MKKLIAIITAALYSLILLLIWQGFRLPYGESQELKNTCPDV